MKAVRIIGRKIPIQHAFTEKLPAKPDSHLEISVVASSDGEVDLVCHLVAIVSELASPDA